MGKQRAHRRKCDGAIPPPVPPPIRPIVEYIGDRPVRITAEWWGQMDLDLKREIEPEYIARFVGTVTRVDIDFRYRRAVLRSADGKVAKITGRATPTRFWARIKQGAVVTGLACPQHGHEKLLMVDIVSIQPPAVRAEPPVLAAAE